MIDALDCFLLRRTVESGGMDQEIAEQLARRDGYRRKLSLLKSPAQRMAEMWDRQAANWITLQSSPEGYAHFLRRNYQARAISVSPDDFQ